MKKAGEQKDAKSKENKKDTDSIKNKDEKVVEKKARITKKKDTPIEEMEEKSSKRNLRSNKKEEATSSQTSKKRTRKADDEEIEEEDEDKEEIVKRVPKRKVKEEDKNVNNPKDEDKEEIVKRAPKRKVKEERNNEIKEDGEKLNEEITETPKSIKVTKETKEDVNNDGADKAKKKSTKKQKKEDEANEEEKMKPKNQTETDYGDLEFDCNKKNSKGETTNFKISSWNVDGIRAWLKKGGLQYVEKELPDVICLQETKVGSKDIPKEITQLSHYEAYWCESEKKGYAGVGLLSKTKPLSVNYGIENEEHDKDGRCITAEYKNFYIVSVYVTNAGRGLVTLPKRLEWNKSFTNYIKKLDKKKPVIICGDMNVAHNEIDLTNPKTNKKNAGFTIEEREGMTEFLNEGFVDTFRKLYPDKKDAYTFWSYMNNARNKNVGWRLDYFIVSERFMDNVCDNCIRNKVFGSDHCPITLFVHV